MRSIQEGRTQEYDERFREGELMALEEARQRDAQANQYQAQRERINRRRSMPQQPSGIEVLRRQQAREAERQARVSSATQELVRQGIPEDVVRDVVGKYI